MERTILCVNSGSSSLKFALFSISGSSEKKLASGALEGIGPDGRLRIRNADGQLVLERREHLPTAHEYIPAIFDELDQLQLGRPAAAGHRIVHGGPRYTAPERVSPELLETLKELTPLAPLHLPAQIDLIEAISRHYPDLPQVTCFDTSFHARMPELAQRMPLPRDLWDRGIKRYGFHGLSYEFILSTLGAEGKGRVIIAHLGNGASMAAILDGKSMDTSMGLTPTGGFMMSTRTGDLDPGVLLYLLRAGYGSAQLDKMLNRESGLMGVSETSSDMKTLLERRQQDPRADLAIAMFCYEIRKFIGAYTTVLGGLDTLVFTGGIGERASAVREEICKGLEFLGIELNPDLNATNASVISTPHSSCSVRVIVTDEDLMIARHTWSLIER